MVLPLPLLQVIEGVPPIRILHTEVGGAEDDQELYQLLGAYSKSIVENVPPKGVHEREVYPHQPIEQSCFDQVWGVGEVDDQEVEQGELVVGVVGCCDGGWMVVQRHVQHGL